MRRYWAVVANRGGAYFFELENGKSIRLFETMINNRGRLKNEEINSDRPGRIKDRFGRAKHAMMREKSPKEQISIEFAKEISRFLEKARSKNQFHRLYLIAPAKLLGEIKFDLKGATQRLIEKTFHKVLREDNMKKHLKRLLFGENHSSRLNEEFIRTSDNNIAF